MSLGHGMVQGNVIVILHLLQGDGVLPFRLLRLPPAEAPPHSSENSPAPGHRPHCRRQDRHTTDCAADCRPDWRWSGTPRTAVPPPRPPGPWPGAPAERGPASPFPVSHLETALSLTRICSASCFWVSPFLSRRALMAGRYISCHGFFFLLLGVSGPMIPQPRPHGNLRTVECFPRTPTGKARQVNPCRALLHWSAGPRSRGCSCSPRRAAVTVSVTLVISATREVGFPTGSSWRKGTK